MRVGISTACFYPKSPLESIEIIGQMGFKFIEIFVNTESEYTKEYADKILEKTKYYGIKIVSIHPYTGGFESLMFFSDYAKRTNDYIKQYTKYFQFANYLGADFFTFHGERKDILTFLDGKEERDIETYKILSKNARESGIYFAQENVSYCKSADYEFLHNLYEKVPDIRFTFDFKQSYRAKNDVYKYLDVMSDKLVNIHINDYDDEKFCKLPGAGKVDFSQFFNTLNNYNGKFLIEVYKTDYKNTDEIINAKKFLENIL